MLVDTGLTCMHTYMHSAYIHSLTTYTCICIHGAKPHIKNKH